MHLKNLTILPFLVLLFSGILNGSSFSVSQIKFSDFPIYFVENQGQQDSQVRYYVPGQENTLYFEKHGLTMVLHPKSKDGLSPVSYSPKDRWNVQLKFVGANTNSKLQGQNVSPTTFNYFRGTKKDWKTGVKTYASLKYSNLWPGIDLIYNGKPNQIKYSFVIQP